MSDNALQVDKSEIVDRETEQTRDRRVFSPFSDIYETDNEIILLLDLPGVNEEDIDITLEKDILSINASVESDSMEGYTLNYAEYVVGDFHRKFRLTKMVDQENISAALNDGVLKITLSKAANSKTKKIVVQGK
jgi:HSP20 family molecular chaperone IbpA